MRIAHHAVLEELGDRCRCGVESSVHRFGCLECGARCCPVCAITLESAAYCHRCAAALLGHMVEKPGPFEVL
jgi:hypothetical protein